MAKKLWGGRFKKPPKESLFDFLSLENAELDQKLVIYDIDGSIAHVCMLAKQKIIKREEAKEIIRALLALKSKALAGAFKLDHKLEDVHTNVEAEASKLTPHAKNMHIARSRNDQICLDTRLYMRDAINQLAECLLQLQESLAALSKKDCVFPAYTHTQVAQPVRLSFWAHAHYQAFGRDLQRLSELYLRVNQNPLGSGAVAGTELPIDRAYTSRLLGFASPTESPMDTVSSRGELEAELLSALCLAMSHASRIAEDCILLASKRLLILPDEFSTGSSMMPQKKNPDPFELVRGKASRMLGLYVHAAGLLKGVPSGYNLDSQESKYALMQGVETALSSLSILAQAIPYLKFDEERIKAELEEGFACATSLANLIAKKGVPFRTAHELVGKIVLDCASKNKFLSGLSASEASAAAGVHISAKELQDAVSVEKASLRTKKRLPEVSPHWKLLSARKKSLEEASQLLMQEAHRISGSKRG
ncbi:MAG: argininosuccinate lyase [Candidatus Micrarchaeota archaeon]|nr:argininosuccinate lyase [Candidatus Micrarchaeota archaeon]